MTCGIYAIINKETGKMYIGQSVNIERRFHQHRYGKGKNVCYIDNAILKYGKDNFDYVILFECSEKELDSEEQKFIKLYGTYKTGYNCTWGGDFNPAKLPEVRKKISEKNKGRKWSEEQRQKMSKLKTGFKHTEEAIEKIRQASMGRYWTEEQKQRMSKNRMEDGNPMWNKNHTFTHNFLLSQQRNTTGYYRVSKEKRNNSQGFTYKYQYYVKGGKKRIVSVNIDELRKKVINQGLLWIDYSKVTLIEI